MGNTNTETSKPSKRRFLRISLRAFLVLTTLATIACGILLPSVRWQQIAVKTIEKYGGSVQYDFQQTNGVGQSQWPAWLVRLLGEDTFHRVVGVNINSYVEDNKFLQNTKHVPEVWKVLSSLPHVRRFSMDYTYSIPATSFEHIQSLTELESLSLHYVVLDADSLAVLASLKQLRTVSIFEGELTDSALNVFAQLPKLESLRLQGTFSNDALATISEASSLVTLQLSGEGSTINDDGVRYLARLKKLKDINLEGSLVSGDGLRQFAPMKNIKVFRLSKTNVTWDKADSFKKSLRPDVTFQGYLERSARVPVE